MYIKCDQSSCHATIVIKSSLEQKTHESCMCSCRHGLTTATQHAMTLALVPCVVTWSPTTNEWLTFNLQKWKRKARAVVRLTCVRLPLAHSLTGSLGGNQSWMRSHGDPSSIGFPARLCSRADGRSEAFCAVVDGRLCRSIRGASSSSSSGFPPVMFQLTITKTFRWCFSYEVLSF